MLTSCHCNRYAEDLKLGVASKTLKYKVKLGIKLTGYSEKRTESHIYDEWSTAAAMDPPFLRKLLLLFFNMMALEVFFTVMYHLMMVWA
jgi:hypothetical protein